jgi:septum formation inhibitor MinC
MAIKGTINPFDITSRSATTKSRRTTPVTSARFSPDAISLSDLKKALKAKIQGTTLSEPLESKFVQYINDGSSHGHLKNQEVASLFCAYTSRKLRENDIDLIGKLSSSDQSILRDHLSLTVYPENSLSELLLDYANRALVAQRNGRNLKENPLPLQDDDNYSNPNDLVRMLTGKSTGLSVNAPLLNQIKNSSDPAVKIVYQIAHHLGLADSISATQKSLRQAQSNELTNRLDSDLNSLLRAEYTKLNEIFLPDGGLIVKRLDKGQVRFIPKIELTRAELTLIGDDARYFDEMSSLDFREFFQKAHEFAVAGNDDELTRHVAQGMSLIYASFNIKLNNPNLTPVARKQLLEDFRLLSDNIQGKGLVTPTLARIIREKVTDATLSSDFINRAGAGQENAFSKKAIAEFLAGAKGPEIVSHKSLAKILTSKGLDIPGFNGQFTRRTLSWIEDSQIPSRDEAQYNQQLSSNKPISLQRAVRAYQDAIDTKLATLHQSLELILTPQNKNIQSIAQARQKIEESFPENFASVDAIVDFVSAELNSISGSGINVPKEKLEQALTEFAISILKTNDTNFKNSTDFQDHRSTITQIAEDIVNRDDPKANIQRLITLLKGKTEDGSFRAIFNDTNGQNTLKSLLNACIQKQSFNAGFLAQVSLDNIETIFNGPEGQELAKTLESLSTAGSRSEDIINSGGAPYYGAFANLLFAQDASGQPDQANRLIALLSLVDKTAGNDLNKLSRLSHHVIERLKIKPTDSSTSLDTQFTRAKQKLSSHQNDFDSLIKMKDRLVFLEENLFARQRELQHLREQSSSVIIRQFGDESKYQEYRNALQSILDKADKLNLNDPRCLDELSRDIENDNNPLALKIVWRLIRGILTGLEQPSSTEAPGDSIERIKEHIQRLLNSRNLATFARSVST